MVRLSIAGCIAAAACTQPSQAEIVQPLESTLGAAVPTAYFAAVAFAALDGQPSPCANVTTPAGSGSDVRVEVSLGPGCPPMFSASDSGTTVVTGTWTPQLATFVMDYTGVATDTDPMLVVGIGTLTVTPSNGTHLLLAYGEQDISIATGLAVGAGIEQTAWVADVDTVGTADPSDDVIHVYGGDQSLIAVTGGKQPDVGQTQVAVDATFDAGCRRNPTSGAGGVQRASSRGGGWLVYAFHSTCDGTTDVVAAMAPYELMAGKKIQLGFLQH
jgi:hypothetical protein